MKYSLPSGMAAIDFDPNNVLTESACKLPISKKDIQKALEEALRQCAILRKETVAANDVAINSVLRLFDYTTTYHHYGDLMINKELILAKIDTLFKVKPE